MSDEERPAPTEVEGPFAEEVEPPNTGDAPMHPGVPGKLGCVLALSGALVFGGGSIGLSYYLMRLRTAPVLDATNELAGIFSTAEQAPGASAARDLGCDQAAAFEVEPLRRVAQRLEEGRAAKEKRAAQTVELGDQPTVVKCWMKRAAGPNCEEVAKAFAGAIHRSAGFTVAIENPNGPLCAEGFAASGDSLGPVKNPNVPPLGE